jgi:FemAB-related protein (PEP-CTERM system-associated)
MMADSLADSFTVRSINLDRADECVALDGFVDGHADATAFHRTAWVKAVAKGCGQRAHYLVAEDGEGAIAGALPLTEIHSPLFGRVLASSGFAVGGGILSNATLAAQSLEREMEALARRLSCPSLELRGGALPSDGWQIDATTYLGFVRDLVGNDEAELLAIPRKQRAEVRKALDLALTVDTGNEESDREAHYRVYAKSVHNLGTPVFPRALFDAVLDSFGDDADILTVRHEGVAVASVLSLYHRGTVMPYWGGGTAAARALRANDLMYYALMNHARRKGCTRFDFGRSKAGTGPAAFKRNWGFEGMPLAYAKRSLDGAAVRDINPLSPRYRMQVALWQRLPLSIANAIGPAIARGLG